jgi:hypothetical protein
MIIPNIQSIDLQEYMINGRTCFDISNNLSQENNDCSNNCSNEVIDYDNLCTICLESIFYKKICLSCGHIYHIPCIIKWFNLQITNNEKTSCPYCKQYCDFENLVKDIILTNLIEVHHIIEGLNFLVKNCNLIILNKYHIITLRRNYIKLKTTLSKLNKHGIKVPINCQYIYISKISLSVNILQLISTIKIRNDKETISESSKYKHNIFKKFSSYIKYIIKYIKRE